MNLLAIIIVFLAIVTAGAIAYIAWELSSGDPVFGSSEAKQAGSADSDDAAGGDSAGA